VTVALDEPPAGGGKAEFYSAESEDSGENFRGTIVFE